MYNLFALFFFGIFIAVFTGLYWPGSEIDKRLLEMFSIAMVLINFNKADIVELKKKVEKNE